MELPLFQVPGGREALLAAVLVLVSTRSSGWVAWSRAGSQQAQGRVLLPLILPASESFPVSQLFA